jgi:hypothetical protein
VSTTYPHYSSRLVEMRDVERAHRGHWFSPDTMRFFRSRIGSYGYLSQSDGAKVFFVSSEQFDYQSPRLYTVRVQDRATGDIESASTFQQYASWSGADRAAQRMARDS